MNNYNTRISPSPTGKAHIGFVRTAYLNYLAARSTGGKFILRIDDTDELRSQDIYTQDLIATLNWLGLDADMLFYQSSRYDRYTKVAQGLIDSNKAIIKDGAVYLNPDFTIKSWTDSIAGNIIIADDKFNAIKNLVLLRSDGTPTYHFASVVDDIDFDIDWIIRGTDHLDNTSKHVYIYDAMNAPLPKFSHVGLIFYQNKKISKRDGVANMDSYNDIHPSAILNSVLKMGWSHSDPNIDKTHPLIDKDLAIQIFNQGHLRSQKATLDLDRLKWLDKKYKSKYKATAL